MADLSDIAAKHNSRECAARGISSTACAQEEVAALRHTFKPAQTASSACKLPEARNARSWAEADTIEGEFAAFALCTMWEKFKSLIGG